MPPTYEQLRVLALRALSLLARQGFTILPDDALDLVHDFWVEQWPGVVGRMDPALGSAEGYAFAAFVRWARPRIVDLQRWRASLADPVGLDPLGSGGEDPSSRLDLGALARAMEALPAQDRKLLLEHFGAARPSERALARASGRSRHGTRKLLVEALAHLVARLERPEGLSVEDWELVHAVWVDGCTPAEAAGLQRTTEPRVRSALGRFRRLVETMVRSRA